MTRQEHLDLLKQKMDKNLDTATRKNNDYCGQGVEVNPFKNFEASAAVGVPAARGILVRMMDKMARISSLLDQEAQVKDESIHDTLCDLSLYALILSNYLDSKNVGISTKSKISDEEFKVGDKVLVKKGRSYSSKILDGRVCKITHLVSNCNDSTLDYVRVAEEPCVGGGIYLEEISPV